ncbi:MAG: hypothetical protein ABSD58_05105 [Verrucomicrobiia bacterium]|jgi:hypothetical protein
MKKSVLLFIAVTLGGWGFSGGRALAAGSSTNAMAISIQIAGAIPNEVAVTNKGVVTTTYSSTAIKLDNEDLLNMLQTEFAVSFPTGAQLAYYLTGDIGFHVLDPEGNSILKASTNSLDSSYVFALSNSVAGGVYADLLVGKAATIEATTNTQEVATDTAPDYGIYYSDSHGNNFHVDGLLVLTLTATQTTTSLVYDTVSFTLTGQGGGKFFNPADGKYDTGVFTKVKVSAKGAGIIQ